MIIVIIIVTIIIVIIIIIVTIIIVIITINRATIRTHATRANPAPGTGTWQALDSNRS